MSAADLSIPIRTALLGASSITSMLTAYQGSFPIFTRRPAPPDTPFPNIMISPDIAKTDQDGINDQRPILTRDISVYGQNDTSTKYRNVETIARAIHDLFHRKRNSITVAGWTVVLITATGPVPAPTDDDQTIARVVPLTIQLAALN